MFRCASGNHFAKKPGDKNCPACITQTKRQKLPTGAEIVLPVGIDPSIGKTLVETTNWEMLEEKINEKSPLLTPEEVIEDELRKIFGNTEEELFNSEETSFFHQSLQDWAKCYDSTIKNKTEIYVEDIKKDTFEGMVRYVSTKQGSVELFTLLQTNPALLDVGASSAQKLITASLRPYHNDMGELNEPYKTQTETYTQLIREKEESKITQEDIDELIDPETQKFLATLIMLREHTHYSLPTQTYTGVLSQWQISVAKEHFLEWEKNKTTLFDAERNYNIEEVLYYVSTPEGTQTLGERVREGLTDEDKHAYLGIAREALRLKSQLELIKEAERGGWVTSASPRFYGTQNSVVVNPESVTFEGSPELFQVEIDGKSHIGDGVQVAVSQMDNYRKYLKKETRRLREEQEKLMREKEVLSNATSWVQKDGSTKWWVGGKIHSRDDGPAVEWGETKFVEASRIPPSGGSPVKQKIQLRLLSSLKRELESLSFTQNSEVYGSSNLIKDSVIKGDSVGGGKVKIRSADIVGSHIQGRAGGEIAIESVPSTSFTPKPVYYTDQILYGPPENWESPKPVYHSNQTKIVSTKVINTHKPFTILNSEINQSIFEVQGGKIDMSVLYRTALKGSPKISNSSVARTTVSGNVSLQNATVRGSNLSGTFTVTGEQPGSEETKSIYAEIIPGVKGLKGKRSEGQIRYEFQKFKDRRKEKKENPYRNEVARLRRLMAPPSDDVSVLSGAYIENVTLSEGYVYQNARIEKQKDISTVSHEGVIYTRYKAVARTRKRGAKRDESYETEWAYTKHTKRGTEYLGLERETQIPQNVLELF